MFSKKYRAGYGARLFLEFGALEGLETTIVQLMKLLMVVVVVMMMPLVQK